MSRTTQVLSTLHFASVTGLSPSMVDVSTSLLLASLLRYREPYNPGDALRHCRFGLVPVRSPLLGESLNCSLILWVLRCFSSPRSLHLMDGGKQACRVAPFGYLRIKSYLPIPAAFRSLSRPSSPLRAKASTECPSFALSISSLSPIYIEKSAYISITLLVYHQ